MLDGETSFGNTTGIPLPEPDIISADSFKKLSEIVYRESGISLSDQKRIMLSTRIAKRLRATGCRSYEEYVEYISEHLKKDTELVYMIDAVTTNKTDFFRENHHFDYLTNTLLPRLDKQYTFSASNPLRIWSAGCSTGEEPYTMAFVLSEYFHGDTEKFRILGTDLSTKVLNVAVKGIYPDWAVVDIPKYLRLKYLQRGRGEWSGFWRVNDKLRKTVSFGKLNFIDADYRIDSHFHLIFHRNVMIYFDRQTRAAIIEKLASNLLEDGYLFIGHSETLHQLTDKFSLEAQTVYRKIPTHHGDSV